jgi:hypothetical protein
MNLASIAIFVYNRPVHTKNLLHSLEKCHYFKKSKIFFFSDHYKVGEKIDKDNVFKVRKIIKNFSQKYKATIYCNKVNLGLYKNIIKGVNQIFKKNSKVIILEDDLILHPNFIKFMNKSLSHYKKKDIFQISGYSYPINYISKKSYFLNISSCWGWGINKVNWLHFVDFISKKKIINNLYIKLSSSLKMKRDFNFNESFNYFKILQKQINSSVSSWGILFYLFCFYKKKLILYPPYSLVKNTGFDGSGNHKSYSNFFNEGNNINKKFNILYPKKPLIDNQVKYKIESFFRNKLSYLSKFKNLMYKFL